MTLRDCRFVAWAYLGLCIWSGAPAQAQIPSPYSTIAAARRVAAPDSVAPAVQVVGTVTTLPQDRRARAVAFVQDSTAGVRVTWERGLLRDSVGPGDVLLVEGRMGTSRGTPRLRASQVQIIRRGVPAIPLEATPGEVQHGSHEGELVALQGRAELRQPADDDDLEVFVRDEHGVVRVDVPDEFYQVPGFTERLHREGRIHAVGVVRRRGGEAEAPEYYLDPRSAADLQMIEVPNTGALMGGAAVVMLLGLLLHLALRRRASERYARDLARKASELQRSEAALRHSDERLRAIVENSFGIVAVFRTDGSTAYLTRAAVPLVPAHVLPGRPLRAIWRRVHREDRKRNRATLRELLDGPGESRLMELRVLVGDEYRSFELRLTNLIAHPAVQGVVLHGRDVTEQRAAEQALAESRRQLEHAQRLDALGRLAGGIAHDFNNLLTVIRGNAEMLLDDRHAAAAGATELEEIRSSADRAAEMTRKLLAFGRGQITGTERVNVTERVRGLEGVIRRLLPEHIRLSFAIDEQCSVRMDPAHLDQVLLNLVLNARDAVGTHGSIRVTVRPRVLSEPRHCRTGRLAPGEYISLSVHDDGTGMDESVMSRMFEPFFTTKSLGSGTGLGLSTVYGLVAQCGGQIAVTSAPGRGSRFRVFLPAASDAASAPGAESREQHARTGVNVLVVEDQADVRRYVSRVLTRRGFHVQEAESGTHGLQLYEADPGWPAIVVSDIVMPGMTGHELAAAIRGRNPDLPFVFLSGYSAPELPTADEAPMQHTVFHAKPFSPDALVAAIHGLLASSVRGAAAA